MSIEIGLANVFALSLPVWLAIDEIMRHRRVATSFSVHDANRIRKPRAESAGIAISLFVALAWSGGAPALAVELPKPLGNTSKAVLLCDRKETGQPVAARVEQAFEKARVMPISSYDDDPFVAGANVECLADSGFARAADGSLLLSTSLVKIQDDDVIFRADPVSGDFRAFANNPWPAPTSNTDGSFRFPDEARFPPFLAERGSDGRIVVENGLQVWLPQDLHLGMTTAFDAAIKVKQAAEDWSGRAISWGVDGLLEINAHAFVDFNSFFSPSARMLFFGVVPYRLPGAPIRIFEVASSWDIVAHETGHAVHHTLKPNAPCFCGGSRTWSESFADQFAMWTSLRDPGRVRTLLTDTAGDFGVSNHLSAIGEAFAAIVGQGTGVRDAVNDFTVSTTSPEVHDRSEVLTGALYRLFVSIYNDLKRENNERALEEAGAILGTFLTLTTDYTPENEVTLEDVAKAYVKVDKELFGARYRSFLVGEFLRREIFGTNSVAEWLAHEAAIPHLRLPSEHGPQGVDALIQTNLDRLGIGPDFGLIVQSVIRDQRRRQTIVRVQLTVGRGADAVPLDNHGILVFRENGTLADYHAPLPSDVFSHVQALALIAQARQLGLDRRGAPLSIVRKPGGALTVEARVMRGNGMNAWMEAFTIDSPHGERREVISGSFGGPAKGALLERAGIILRADELARE